MTQRWIMHLDIDAFFASIEKVRNPHLTGKPVIVGSGVIASCCYTARRHGLSAGMNLSEARRICPQVIILAGNYPVYKAFAERIWEICHDITPAVDTLLDDAYLDLTGVTRLYGSLLQMAQKLQANIRQVTGLAVTLGLGTSRTVARLASAAGKPNGVRLVEAGSERAFLEDLPVEKLPGVGRKRAEIFHKLNIHTIGDLADLPAGSLEQIFGANGTSLYERSQGRDSQILNANKIPRTISRETSFHADTIDRSKIEAMLYYLTERTMKTLRELKLLTKTVTVKIRYSDGPGDKSAARLPQATALDSEAFDQALRLLNRLYTRRVALHGVGVVLSNFSLAAAEQPGLFDYDDRNRIDLYIALDAIRQKHGYRALVTGPSIQLLNHLPQDDQGFVLRTPSLTK